jgi:hypothetical protein
MSKFGRDDIKDFIRNFQEASWGNEEQQPGLLNECGCEESEYSLDSSIPTNDQNYAELANLFSPMQPGYADAALCPDSYNLTADAVLQDPNNVIELLKPAMQQLGVGCPASLAKAVADILNLSQETGITPIFKT